MAKKKKRQLTYFLDHPQIKRNPSPGNGNAPGSLAESINFGGKNTAAQQANVKASQPKSQPKTQTSPSSTKSSGVMKSIRKAFGGK